MSTDIIERVILDLSQTGRDFIQKLYELFHESKHDEEVHWVVSSVFQTVVGDVARLLSFEPTEALEHLKSFPYTQNLDQVLLVINFQHLDELNIICQEHCLAIFLKLHQQSPYQTGVGVIPIQVGDDYVLIDRIIR